MGGGGGVFECTQLGEWLHPYTPERLLWLCVLTQLSQPLPTLIKQVVPMHTRSDTCLCALLLLLCHREHPWESGCSRGAPGWRCACLCWASLKECTVGWDACTHRLALCVCVHLPCSFGAELRGQSSLADAACCGVYPGWQAELWV